MLEEQLEAMEKEALENLQAEAQEQDNLPEKAEEVIEKSEEPAVDYDAEFEKHGYKIDEEKASDSKYLKGRLFSTMGMLKKNSEELKDYKAKLSAQEDEYNRKIRELEERVSKIPETAPDEEAQPNFSDELGDEYDIDEDVAKSIDSLVSKRLTLTTKQYKEEIENLKNKLNDFESKTSEQKFWDDVYSRSAKAKNIVSNDFDSFSVWLEQPLYGSVTRKSVFDTGDSSTVARLFDDYVKDINNDAIPDTVKNQQTVMPSTHSVGQTGDKPILTREYMEQFYIDCVRGKYKPEEEARLEAEIIKAVQEGRVK